MWKDVNPLPDHCLPNNPFAVMETHVASMVFAWWWWWWWWGALQHHHAHKALMIWCHSKTNQNPMNYQHHHRKKPPEETHTLTCKREHRYDQRDWVLTTKQTNNYCGNVLSFSRECERNRPLENFATNKQLKRIQDKSQ